MGEAAKGTERIVGQAESVQTANAAAPPQPGRAAEDSQATPPSASRTVSV